MVEWEPADKVLVKKCLLKVILHRSTMQNNNKNLKTPVSKCGLLHFGYILGNPNQWDCWQDQNWELNRSRSKLSTKNPLINIKTLSISEGPSTKLFFSVGTNKQASILCHISGPSQKLVEEKWRYFLKIKPKNGSETYPCWMFHFSNTSHANTGTYHQHSQVLARVLWGRQQEHLAFVTLSQSPHIPF